MQHASVYVVKWLEEGKVKCSIVSRLPPHHHGSHFRLRRALFVPSPHPSHICTALASASSSLASCPRLHATSYARVGTKHGSQEQGNPGLAVLQPVDSAAGKSQSKLTPFPTKTRASATDACPATRLRQSTPKVRHGYWLSKATRLMCRRPGRRSAQCFEVKKPIKFATAPEHQPASSTAVGTRRERRQSRVGIAVQHPVPRRKNTYGVAHEGPVLGQLAAWTPVTRRCKFVVGSVQRLLIPARL